MVTKSLQDDRDVQLSAFGRGLEEQGATAAFPLPRSWRLWEIDVSEGSLVGGEETSSVFPYSWADFKWRCDGGLLRRK